MKSTSALTLLLYGLRQAVAAPPPRAAAKQHYGLNPNDRELFGAPRLDANQIDSARWKVTCDSEQAGNECGNAIDGDGNTFWHTSYTTSGEPQPPHSITIDLGSTYSVNGLAALPRQDGSANGYIARHDVSVSPDGSSWESVASGTWHGDITEKYANFEAKQARYLRLTALSEFNGNPWTSVADVKIFQAINRPQQYDGKGRWGKTINFPTVPVAAVVDPITGKVLVWSAYSFNQYTNSPKDRVFTASWDPADGIVTSRLVDSTEHDMFCPGLSIDGTGKMVITGGNSAEKTTLYDFTTGDWIKGPSMNIARGYQSSVTCSDGHVFTIGGSWSGGEFMKPGEIYNPNTGTWTSLPGAKVEPMLTNDNQGIYRADNHAWLFGWKNGSIFQAGPSTAMNWYFASGDGNVKSAGQRGSDRGLDLDSMCGNAIMFDAINGKILAIGGAPSYEDSEATAHAHLITISSPDDDAVDVKFASNGMWSRRIFHSSVVLPDGKVFITGGQSHGVPFSDDTAQLTPELYDPDRDQFYTQQPNSIARVYHSISVLLPDGRVFNGGGGLCGNCVTNHFDGQIFTPQYLLNTDGSEASRPSITSATHQDGKVSISTNAPVASASLVRYGTSTHSVNTDQRRIPLSLSPAGTNQYVADLPTDTGILLPGYYMLFVLDDRGVPSIAKTMTFFI